MSYLVESRRILKKLDDTERDFWMRMHPHPPQSWYVYKFYIFCQVVGRSYWRIKLKQAMHRG